MPEGRPRLYKIRRLRKRNGKDLWEWLVYTETASYWVGEQMDGTAFTDLREANKVCEQYKSGKLRHPDALYHCVVPV